MDNETGREELMPKLGDLLAAPPRDLAKAKVSREEAAKVATLAALNAAEPGLHVARWAMMVALAAFVLGVIGLFT